MSAVKKEELEQSEGKPSLGMVKKDDGVDKIDLLQTITAMSLSVSTMKDIIQKANFIALNASIEAARTQTQRENFSLVADQVRRQAERTEELSSLLANEVENLEEFALRAQAVNFTDVANDIIDKIDRNLFERNCDMQAWAQFRENVVCAEIMRGMSAQEVKDLMKNPEPAKKAAIEESCKRLEILAKTYNVYVDIFLINSEGVIISTADNRNLIGHDLSEDDVYTSVMKSKETYVKDMFMDPLTKAYTVAYNAPVATANGDIIGLVSTRFNWDYVTEMVDKMPLGDDGNIYIISSLGTILSSRNHHGILVDNLTWLMAGEKALSKHSGYTIECARNGQLSAWGFCHTFGYNAYGGKQWSAIVSHPVNINQNRFFCELISREVEAKRQAAPDANRNLQKVADIIQKHVKSINTINNETNMLAVNAAIQAGVAGAEGEAFSVIASEIGQLARQSEEFVHNINSLTRRLEDCVKTTVYNRLGEAAFDTVDKVDRNLYERNCDIQAFASFNEFSQFLEGDADKSEKEISDLLRKLHEIYEVYHDIYLLDSEGTIKASAVHREVVGQNQGDRSWFRECLAGNLVVTDFYVSKTINDYTVTFAAPVKGSSGQNIGVLTTRFNCEFINDILKATIVGNNAHVYLINSKGFVIGTPTGEGILERSFAHLKAFRMLNRNHHGHTLEEDSNENNETFAIGYAKTQGYINYRGKGWSVLIRQSLQEHEEESDSLDDESSSSDSKSDSSST